MNILFLTDKNVDPLIGGIERITYALAKSLHQLYGYECHSLYTQENHRNTTTDDVFSSKTLIQKDNAVEQISDLIQGKGIDIVVAQGSADPVHKAMPIIREGVDRAQTHTKIVFVFHNMPGHELIPMNKKALVHRLFHTKDKAWSIKQFLIQSSQPLTTNILKKKLRNKYAIPYQLSDSVVLLADGFTKRYDDLACAGTDKFTTIGNSLTLNEQTVDFEKKEKIVLMVTRLDERQKRVEAGLRVWKEIEKDSSLLPWKLIVVGYGPDAEYYAKLTEKLKLQRVVFTGLADPVSYYHKAQIFLMTSAFEGWGLTLTEAEQCGCVPLAYDSYEAVHDIITDGHNGYIIPNNNIQKYTEKLIALMINPEQLRQMQENAQSDCLRHSQATVSQKWDELFHKLINDHD